MHAPAGSQHAARPDVTTQAPARCGCPVHGSDTDGPRQLHDRSCPLRQHARRGSDLARAIVNHFDRRDLALARGDATTAAVTAEEIALRFGELAQLLGVPL
jgi:hypothetical protein